MTSRFWSICAIPFLPMGAATVALAMTLLGERALANPEHPMVVVLAPKPPLPSKITHALDRSFSDARARPSVGTGRSSRSEVR